MFGGDFAPRGWAFCNGGSLLIQQFELLFNLILTTYGGDGTNTFNLPDLRGRVAAHRGQAPGMQRYQNGERLGAETVTLSQAQMPAHTHAFQASKGAGTTDSPVNQVIGSPPAVRLFKAREAPESRLPPAMVRSFGGSQPHANRMPYLAISYIIALDGIFPSKADG